MKPETPGTWIKVGKGLGFGAGFAAALTAVIDPVTKIDPVVLKRVKQAADAPVLFIKVPKGPAAESRDR